MKVFYNPKMVAQTSSMSPSAFKPKLAVADWISDPNIDIELCDFEAAIESQLCLAHDTDYVRGVLDCVYENGFGNTDSAVAASLPYVTGAMIAASECAVLNRELVCAPISGAHHAGYDYAAGFCTFNFLLIAAIWLKRKRLVNRVSILDLDRHVGCGSSQIIKHLQLDWVVNHSQGRYFHSRADCVDGKYMDWLNSAIDDCLETDLVLVQLGVDSHLLDCMGGLQSTPELADRDRCVFQRLGHMPLSFVLAGGYQVVSGNTPAERLEPVLALHKQTARIACEVMAGATYA